MTLFKVLPITFCILMLSVSACKQELPQKVDQEPVFGTVEEIKSVPSQKQLMYALGQDPAKQNWGSASGYYLKVDGKMYPVHWDAVEKFKALKVGDKVNLHPTEFIACTGENDVKPECHRLMEVYRSERRINPLSPSH